MSIQRFGVQTVTVVERDTTGHYDALGNLIFADRDTDVPDCRHRPLRAEETITLEANMARIYYQTTAPPVPAILNVRHNGLLRVDGVDEQIDGGPKIYTDNVTDKPYKVTVLSHRTAF